MMAHRGIYVEVDIQVGLERLWSLTQDPSLHPRWDVRFSSITPVSALDGGRVRFRYERRLPFHTIAGTGTSLGQRVRSEGSATSVLRFTTRDRLSPLGDGQGYWRYTPTADGIRFVTGYDYAPGWGRMLDALVLRRLIGWVTAWSFDRLRIWAETGVEPERWPLASALLFWRSDRPRASRCRRIPRRGHAMADAPEALGELEKP